MDINKIHNIYFKLREKYLQYHNVSGMGIGEIEKNGLLVGELGIVVLVYKKLPVEMIKNGEVIPSSFDGVTIDVREPRLTEKEHRIFLKKNKLSVTDFDEIPDRFWINHSKLHRIMQMEKSQDVIMAPLSASYMPPFAVKGEIFVIEDSNLDLLFFPDNSADLWTIYQVFRTEFGDHYDFVFIHFDLSSSIPDQRNFYSPLFNNSRGIFFPEGNYFNRRDWDQWGSNKILSIQGVSGIDQVRRCLHETAHQWCAYVYHQENGQTSQNLHYRIVPDPSIPNIASGHWGTLVDREKSCMGQKWEPFDWIDTDNEGEYKQLGLVYGSPDIDEFGFHNLDLYLMGFIDASEVKPFRYIENPQEINNSGIYRGDEVGLAIQDIINEVGVREPAYPDTQRVFHQAHILITKDLSSIDTPSAQYGSNTPLGNTELYRKATIKTFREKTWGRGMIDGSLLHENFDKIYIRDNMSDSGAQSSAGAFWNSPDIWVRNQPDNETEHQHPIQGQDNHIYVRVHNSSSLDYENVIVRIYMAESMQTEFFYPEDWKPERLIDEKTVNVPANDSKITSITWESRKIPDQISHPCLLAEIIPMEITPELRHNVQNNRKLAQKNLKIIAPPAYVVTEEVSFRFGHPTRRNDDLALLTISRSKDLPGLELALEPDNVNLQVNRNSEIMPESEYLGVSILSRLIRGHLFPFFERIISGLTGRNRPGEVLSTYHHGGRVFYKLVHKQVVGILVRFEDCGATTMKMHINIKDTPADSRRGLVRIIQSTMDGTVVGGADIEIRP